MKVVILAGGYGTRISEETDTRPKPMVEIGGKPILWHIMKYYSTFGYKDFVLCLGYKGYLIKEYFVNYYLHQSDITINLADNSQEIHSNSSEDWKVSLVDTGLHTMTGGRIKRIQKHICNERFMLTYGDGLSDVNLDALLEAHKKTKTTVTVTATRPKGRFGIMHLSNNDYVEQFHEKRPDDTGWVNGGFFVCEPEIFDYLENDQTILEKDPLTRLVSDRQLYAYKHNGFWQPMDTLKDNTDLNQIWQRGSAPWKRW